MREHDFDWIVIGSGFGGSVSALRLAEKGYKVAVLEAGRRFATRSSRRRPGTRAGTTGCRGSGCAGIMRMTLFQDVFVVSGCGVGGGSLGYANTLYRAPGRLLATRSGVTWPTGRPSSPRTTTLQSGCSA